MKIKLQPIICNDRRRGNNRTLTNIHVRLQKKKQFCSIKDTDRMNMTFFKKNYDVTSSI